MNAVEKKYIDILSYKQEYSEKVEDHAYIYIKKLREGYNKILKRMTKNDKETEISKKLRRDYIDICHALKAYKDRSSKIKFALL